MAEAEDNELLQKYDNTPVSANGSDPLIIAIGVGGGGGNAINYMCTQDIHGVDFVAMNTDRQALEKCTAPTRLLLGPRLCKGLGAGGDPSVGGAAAEESVPEIEKLVDGNVDMVFITAGMGGGTGTGASPVVARVTKDKGILTVGIVTIPFFFEGIDKMQGALDGAARLKKNVDALLVINNDRLSDIYPDMEWSAAFSKADDILATAARSITEMVTNHSVINIDMRDVSTTLRNGQTAFISVGFGEGENRMSKAIQNALHSPLLCDTDVQSSRHLLFAFYYSHQIDPPLRMAEINEANSLVAEMRTRVKVIFGWGYDDSLGNQIKFTVLASGFDVTIEHSASDSEGTIIRGNENQDDQDNNAPIDKGIVQAYGRDKVENLQRRQETQNYYILTPEQLDSDEAIEMLENSPAYKRDKRKETAAKTAATSDSGRDTSKPSNSIIFSLDDR